MQKDCHFYKNRFGKNSDSRNFLNKSKIYPKSNIISNPKRLDILAKHFTYEL